jgi:chromosome segregation ATPase
VSESLDIQMARLQEQLKSVIATLAEDREERKVRHKQISRIEDTTDRLDLRLGALDLRMGAVEMQLAQNQPTIQEFLRIKHQVQGAGFLGKWTWAIGGVLIAGIYNSREAIRAFLN